MPWLGYRNMTDDELRSIWQYLRSLPSATRADTSSRRRVVGE
jgi:hypothetical protein